MNHNEINHLALTSLKSSSSAVLVPMNSFLITRFKDCYAVLQERGNKDRPLFNLKSGVTTVNGPIIDCIFHMREDRKPFYDEGFLKKGGIESILKSNH